MQKYATAFLLLLLHCSSWGQQSNLLSAAVLQSDLINTVSPKLRALLVQHTAALLTLTNAFSSAFTNKTVRLFYFYPEKGSDRRAFHFYPNMAPLADVYICVPEDQDPLDEFIDILFEALNTKGQARFAKIDQDARLGTISRADYAREKIKVEFEAEKSTRDLLVALRFSDKDIANSVDYPLYIRCPDSAEDFLAYLKNVNGHMDVFQAYEVLYDSIRKTP